MKNNSIYRLGSICSIFLGISYVVVGITAILLPPTLNGQPNIQSPFMYFDANKTILLTQYWSFELGAIFALAVIPAVSATVLHLNEGWVRWTSALATLGFAVAILDNYWAIVETPARAAAYATGSEAIRAALTLPGSAQFIDIQGWLGYGAVGIWALVTSLLALRGKAWPRALAYLGIISAMTYFLALASQVLPSFSDSGMIAVVAGIGAVLGPIWYGWMGLSLYRKSSQTSEQAVRNQSAQVV